MTVAQLREVLGRFADLKAGAASGRRPPEAAKALRALADGLARHDRKTVKAFVKDMKARRAKRDGAAA